MTTRLSEYAALLGREFLSPVNYVSALAIGLIITVTMGHWLFYSIVPYLVPLLVQAFSKALVSFRYRTADILLRLPGERKDPAFVMDEGGTIVASTGGTGEFFKRQNISRIDQIFTRRGADDILATARKSAKKQAVQSLELPSEMANKWYQVQVKWDESAGANLVWLDDITPRKELDYGLSALRSFSSDLISSIHELMKSNDVYDRLARVILDENYRGVFIAREVGEGNLAGHVFKMNGGELIKSGLTYIPKTSQAPVLMSRRTERIVSASNRGFKSQEVFDEAHPFDERVKVFLGFPVRNFINYHEGDISIIAFNRENGISQLDRSLMETVVNTARTATFLIDLAITNDDKFLQIITGLCAAAEYSDEMTGRHILRVNEYSYLLACELGLDDEFSDNIHKVAAMHDIGKVGIPEIIKLERKLTDEEILEMQMHTIYGAQIIDQMITLAQRSDPRLDMARNIALYHHQQWNGAGYPGLVDERGGIIKPESRHRQDYRPLRPLKAEAIPIEALIVSLADKYDALRSARSYKPAFSHEKTTELLLVDDRTGNRAEDVFGPEIARLYLDIQDRFDRIFNDMQDA